MMKLTHSVDSIKWLSWLSALLAVAILVFGVSAAQAKTEVEQTGKHVLTVYDGGSEMGVLTEADTLGEALKEAGIVLSENDVTEPGLDEELVAGSYSVNIYRARAVMVVDGGNSTKIMSPYRSVDQIAKQANIELRDEDEAKLTASTVSMLSDGALERMVIDRATPFILVLYGKKIDAYTQATTVGKMLDEKDIKLGNKDKLSLPVDTKITAGMKLEIYRDGKQTITVEEAIKKPIREIQDANRDVGYREVKTAGKDGTKQVTYEVVMKNGKEISRNEINSVTTKAPAEEVVIVGSKSNFSYKGGPLNDEQINALGNCESGMNPTTNTGNGFHGAFQFSPPTWNSMGTGYDYAYQAPLSVQKQAVQKLLSGSSIYNQFPGCAKKMSSAGIL